MVSSGMGGLIRGGGRRPSHKLLPTHHTHKPTTPPNVNPESRPPPTHTPKKPPTSSARFMKGVIFFRDGGTALRGLAIFALLGILRLLGCFPSFPLELGGLCADRLIENA